MSSTLSLELMMIIQKIYKAGHTFGAIFINKGGRKCSSFFRRTQLMAVFVKSRFAARTKNRHNLRVYLQERRGVKHGLKTVAFIDLRQNAVVSYRSSDAVVELAEAFEMSHQICA